MDPEDKVVLEAIPKAQQEQRFIELRYVQGLSHAEVAAATGVREKNASRLDEALRQRLKRDLRARGVGDDAAR
jgi:RNA polymerase sigma factor for flagellar operon FliA